tara:strand:- start:604 stop:1068 length:465 start_codon:yes stop_codon:yes gene_type:complete
MYDTGFNDPMTGGGLAPLQSAAVQQQGVAPAVSPGVSGAAGGGLFGGMFGGGNQQTVTAPDGTITQSGNPGFFSKAGGAGLALGAIQTLGSLWNSAQQNKMAKKSFALQEESYRTNLGNQTKTYNTALEDRINARYATEGRSGEAAAYIDKNKL